jgi:hypothetical protein
LQAAAIHFHKAWDFAETDDAFIGNVCHMTLAVERQQVVLAQAEKINVPHHHHLIVLDCEQRAVKHIVDILKIPFREKTKSLVDAIRRFLQSVSGRILSKRNQHLGDQTT